MEVPSPINRHQDMVPVAFNVEIPDLLTSSEPSQGMQVEADDPVIMPSSTVLPPDPEIMDLNAMLEWVIECEEAALAAKTLSPSSELMVQNSPADPNPLMSQRMYASPSPTDYFTEISLSFDKEKPPEFRHEVDMGCTTDRLFEDPRLSIISIEHSYATKPQTPHKDLLDNLKTWETSKNEIVMTTNLHQGPSSVTNAVMLPTNSILLDQNSLPLVTPASRKPASARQRCARKPYYMAKESIKCYVRKRKICFKCIKLSSKMKDKIPTTSTTHSKVDC